MRSQNCRGGRPQYCRVGSGRNRWWTYGLLGLLVVGSVTTSCQRAAPLDPVDPLDSGSPRPGLVASPTNDPALLPSAPEAAVNRIVAAPSGWFERVVEVVVDPGTPTENARPSNVRLGAWGQWTPTTARLVLRTNRSVAGPPQVWIDGEARQRQAAVIDSILADLALGVPASISMVGTGKLRVEASVGHERSGVEIDDRWTVGEGAPPLDWAGGPAGEVGYQ